MYELLHVEPVPKRILYDGKTRIEIHAKSWQKQHAELWNLLVPGSGHAGTVQGEVVRISGKLAYELLDNGGINWDADYNNLAKHCTGMSVWVRHYRQMNRRNFVS
ncbi:MAG: hypothetical protein ACLSCO_16680 [Gallintestinimicrobium sp.]